MTYTKYLPLRRRRELVRRGGRPDGDKNETGKKTRTKKTRAKTRRQKQSPARQGQEKNIAYRHGPFRHAAVGAARLSSAALASNPLRAVLRGMRGIRHHTGSVRIVDDALAQPRSRSKFIGPRTRNRPHQCRRCPQPARETRALRATPQPRRRAHGACAVDPPRPATDAKYLLPDATRPEASARAASRAGAQRAHHNADPSHQRQQSSGANDLSAQLRSMMENGWVLPMPAGAVRFKMRRLECWAASRERRRGPCIARRSQSGCRSRRADSRSAGH